MMYRGRRRGECSCGAWPIAVAVATATVVVGCGPRNEFQPRPPAKVTVSHPLRQQVVERLEFTGTTSAIESVDVRARVEGFLEAIHFTEGQEVNAGDLLFAIDPRPFKAAVARAEADVALAKAQLSQAKASRDRAGALRDNADARFRRAQSAGAAVTTEELDLRRTEVASAQADFDAAEATVASAEANIAAAEAALENARLDLEFTQVTAPITGRVGERMVDVGNLVGVGEPTLLTRITRYDPIYAYFTVSESAYLRWVRMHDDAEPLRRDEQRQQDDPTIVNLALADEQDFPHQGVIDYADLDIESSTGTYLVRGEFPNPRRVIAPGAFVRLQVPLDPVEALLIEETAIGHDQAGAYLRVVNEKNVVETVRVALGNHYGSMRAVTSEELTEDDWVVVNGLQMARPGAEVDPQQVASEPPADSPGAQSEPPSSSSTGGDEQ